MKKIVIFLLVMMLLVGCRRNNDAFDRAMSLRTDLLNANGCSFNATVSAEFSDKTYTFALFCQSDKDGNLTFEVLQPSYISGIKGSISSAAGKLVFDDTALTFPLQTEGVISPISGPWVLLQALSGGYVHHCGQEEEYLRLTVDDSYEEDALRLDVWINSKNQPVQADIYENNRRILTLSISDYQLL